MMYCRSLLSRPCTSHHRRHSVSHHRTHQRQESRQGEEDLGRNHGTLLVLRKHGLCHHTASAHKDAHKSLPCLRGHCVLYPFSLRCSRGKPVQTPFSHSVTKAKTRGQQDHHHPRRQARQLACCCAHKQPSEGKNPGELTPRGVFYLEESPPARLFPSRIQRQSASGSRPRFGAQDRGSVHWSEPRATPCSRHSLCNLVCAEGKQAKARHGRHFKG
mmetsp:Transcript_21833/g.50678  ORF Transcript_21833/g.50678 Transcript_21833/m.50678 type:complete len:216 (+) Transcript_21833:505-1152(+)